MTNIIDKIRVSGTDYTLSATSSGGNPTVELTQAEYDALVSAGTVSADTYYIITDAQAGDLSQYWTSAQTNSAITQATSGKVNTSSVVSSVTSASTDSEIPTAKAVWNVASQGGGGGGTTYSAGTNIDITNDTINCTLPIREGSNSSGKGIIVGDSECSASGKYAIAIGHNADANGENSLVIGDNTSINSTNCIVVGSGDATHYYKGGSKFISVGDYNSPNYTTYSALFGYHVTVKNNYEVGIGTYNISNTGSNEANKTRFSIGNGYHFGSTNVDHNIIDVRNNGDIYIADTNASGEYYEKPMIKLQDALGGGGGGITSGEVQSMIDESISGKTDESAFTAHTADATIHVTAQDKTNWNNKSNFSGSYNDLTDKPTIPTSASQLTNDAGYITSSALNGYATEDYVDAAVSGKADSSTVSSLNNVVTAHTADTTIHVTTAQTASWDGAVSDIATVSAATASNTTALGGLKLVKLTQAEYDALATKDSNTLYVING